MGRMSKKDVAALAVKPTHKISITVNGAKFCEPWLLTEDFGKRVLDDRQAKLPGSQRVSPTELRHKIGYGLKVYKLSPLD